MFAARSAIETSTNFGDHNSCIILSRAFRGKLCERLASRASVSVPARATLYSIGDRANSIFFLRKGLVKASIVSGNGKELLLAVYKPGEIFGELCFCSKARREQAVAMEGCEIVEIRFHELIAELRKSEQAMSEMFHAICVRLSDAQDQLALLSFDRTMERLVHKLLQLSAQLGEPVPEGTAIAHYIRQEELAQMIAAPREVVSTLLNELRRLGLLGYSRRGRFRVDTEALRAYLNSITSQ